MQKVILRNGLYGVVLMVAVLLSTFLVFQKDEGWELQEVIGYITIVLSLLFVYAGIRQWRNQYNKGLLTFGQGLKIGFLITLFPSVAFGLFSWIQMNMLDPGFHERYYSHYVEKIKQTTPPGQLQAALQKIEAEREMFSSPLMQFLLMFVTVFAIGIIITVISSFLLRRTASRTAIV